MGIFNQLREFIDEKGLIMNYYDNKLYIANYKDIPIFNNNKIIINYQNGLIIITGVKLVVTKLLNEEILISGVIKGIELGD